MNASLRHHRPLLTRIRHAIALIAMIGFVANQLQATSHQPQALFAVPAAHAAAGIYKPIHYQGKVSQIGGSAIANDTYNMQFKLYDAATNGTLLWTETWNSGTEQVTMTGGLFSVALGTHTAMTNVNFNTDNLFLQVEFDPGNDGTYEEVFSPRRRLGSVPYAHNADRLDGLDGTQLLRTDARNTTTGSLLVNTGGLAIRTPGTISGSVLHATRLLSSSGGLRITSTAVTGLGAASVIAATSQTGAYISASGAPVLALNAGTTGTKHIAFGYAGTFDTTLYRSAVSRLTTDGSLYVLGTLSGASFYGAGLTNCDPTTGKLVWNNGAFSCGTDGGGGGVPEVGTAAFSGAVLTLGNARYVMQAGDTMTGALIIQNGNTHSATSTPLLNIRGAMSGRSLYVSGTGSAPLLVTNITTGKVGIGTASPTALLSLFQTTGRTDINFNQQGILFSLGVDGNDGGKFKLSGSSTLGTADIITILPNSLNTSYSNPGGTGSRNGTTITLSDSGDLTWHGDKVYLLDGSYANALYWDGIAAANKWLKFDFGSAKIITEAKWYQSTTSTHGIWQWQGSTDDSSWLNIGTQFTLGGTTLQTITTLAANATGYRYYRLLGISGTTASSPFLNEIEFKVGNPVTPSYVGIGTSSPETELEVSGTMSGQMLRILNGTTGTGIFLDQNGNGIALDIDSEATSAAGLRISMPTNNAVNNPHILFGYANAFDTSLYRAAANTLQTDDQFKLTALDAENRALLVLDSEESTTTQNVLTITSDASTNENLVFRIQANGQVFSDGAYAATGADYAEWFYAGTTMAPGEVVCIDVTRRNTVQRCDRDADPNVMGIISGNPGFVGNQITGAEGLPVPGYVLVGLIGQVTTRVTDAGGPIRPGDSLAAGVSGFARKAQAGESTVGVALEELEEGTGTINVLISRRNQSLTVEAVEEKIIERISAMEIEDEVRLMVSEALGDLTVEESITEAVQAQINALQFRDAIDALRQRIDILESRNTASASGAVQTPHGASPSLSSGGILHADMLELQETLLVGTDARIGGDLYLDGSLIMESLFVPGSIDIEQTVHAGRIEAGSGSHIDGTLVLDGELRIGTGSIRYQSGAVAIDDLLVERSLLILGDVTIQGLTRFFGIVEIWSELRLPTKQAGRTRILAGQSKVDVRFGSGFLTVPIVTVSPEDFATSSWRVQPVTATGFTIELQRATDTDIGFAWHAFVTVEDNTTPLPESIDPDQPIPFPVDSLGVPVSSDAVWNACIRSVTMTDADGNSFDCAPFHDDATWRHPDLQIAFIWNDKLTPAFLQIPQGYRIEVTDSAANVATGFTRTDPTEATEDPEENDPASSADSAEARATEDGTGALLPLPENETETLAPPSDDMTTTPTEEVDTSTPLPAPIETTSSLPAQPTDPPPAVEVPPMTPAEPPAAPQEPAADAPSEETPVSTTMP